MTSSEVFARRAFSTNGAGTRSLVRPTAAFPGRIAGDPDLAVAVNRQQTVLAAQMGISDTTMTVADPTQIVTNALLSIDSEIVRVTGAPSGNVVPIARAFDGTAAAVHLTSAAVSGFIDAWHHNSLSAEVQAIESTLGVNLSRIPASPLIVSSTYNFPAQSPGGNLIVGNNTITLTPVPAGVNGTDLHHYLYVSGGTGTAEAVLITGGSAVAGAASGTLIIQCAYTHSGAWTIRTATAGVMEAVVYIQTGMQVGSVYLAPGNNSIYAPIWVSDTGVSITGAGAGASNLIPQYPNMNVITFHGNPGMSGNTLSEIGIYDTVTTSASPEVYLIVCYNTNSAQIRRLIINGGAGAIYNTGSGSSVGGTTGAFLTFVSEISATNQTYCGIRQDSGSGIRVHNCAFGGAPSPQPTYGFQALDGTFYIVDTDFYRMGIGLYIKPGANQSIGASFVEGSSFDSNQNQGVLVQPASPGQALSVHFSNCWVSFNLTHGIYLDCTSGLIDGFSFSGGRIFQNQCQGVLITGTTAANLAAIRFVDNDIAVNSSRTPNTWPNVDIAAGLGDIMFVGNRIGSPYQAVTRAASTGINIAAGNGDQIMIRDNIIAGDTVPLYFGATGTHCRLADNIGVDTLVPQITSAATINIGPSGSRIFALLGTVAITTINGGRIGQSFTFYKFDAGSVTIGGAGNIPIARTLAQYQSVTLTFDGTTFY